MRLEEINKKKRNMTVNEILQELKQNNNYFSHVDFTPIIGNRNNKGGCIKSLISYIKLLIRKRSYQQVDEYRIRITLQGDKIIRKLGHEMRSMKSNDIVLNSDDAKSLEKELRVNKRVIVTGKVI